MFITNIILDDHILDRRVFDDINTATFYAREKAKEKVWHLPGAVYYGHVEARVYEINPKNTSDYKDEYLFSFTGSRRDSNPLL